MIQVPLMLVDSQESAYNFAINNGKVIFITEDQEEQLQYLPNRINASVLLPPYEATAYELDGNLVMAEQLYHQWLCNRECLDFINLIALAAMKNIPVALYFGKEMKEMKYPAMFLNFILKSAGIQVGYGIQPGYLDEQFVSINLATFLITDLIDIPSFFFMMPVGYDIIPSAITVLANALRPPLKPGSSLQDMNVYFKNLIKEIHTANKYLYNPIVAG